MREKKTDRPLIGKVKTRTLENHEDAAPKTILTVSLSTTRLVYVIARAAHGW